MKNIVVLGGYGNFGKRIVQGLLTQSDVHIYVTGRSLEKAKLLCEQLQKKALGAPVAQLTAKKMDIHSDTFTEQLSSLSPFLVIHTCGPYQGQDYRIPKACIEVGAHYIDLADDRNYVCNIDQLTALAQKKKLMLISGASTVPGLSSVVVAHYQSLFQEITDIDIAIAPGNKAEKGEATLKAILSYTGHKFSGFDKGKISDIYGWMDVRKVDFGSIIGARWLANVDVPDLQLFPAQFKVTNSVRFQAGLELPLLHFTLYAMAKMVRFNWVKNWQPLIKPILYISRKFEAFGTDIGGMYVYIKGYDKQGLKKSVRWSVYADKGVGPYIPAISAIIMAKKIAQGDDLCFSAQACMQQYTLDEFMPHANALNLFFDEEVTG